MILSNLKIRFYLLFILFLSSITVGAKDNKNSGVKASHFEPKTIELVQSTQSININTEAGNVSLPQYKKKEIYQSFLSGLNINKRLNLREDISLDLLNAKLKEREELKKLSDMLGIHNLNASYIDFYREVAGWLGTRYRMGSMSSKAVDCSGFTKIIYNKVFEIDLPRTSRDMSNSVKETLEINELLPGDLVFFATRGKKYINHVGMYLGEGHFVHASIKGVKVSDLTDGYYKKTWRKAGRV